MPRKRCCKLMGVKWYGKRQRRENYKILRLNGISANFARLARDWRQNKIFEVCLRSAKGDFNG